MLLSRRKFLRVSTGIVSVFGLSGFYTQQLFYQTKEYFIKGANKHTANIKLVQLTDLHLHRINRKLKNIVKQVNSLAPDIIVFTGDTVDNPQYMQELDDLLALFDGEPIKIAILGNWEYWGNIPIKELQAIYQNYDCQLLINESKQFTFDNKTITITGVDDLLGGIADYKKAVENAHQSDYHIVLNHCPAYYDTIIAEQTADLPIDLVLSGHTHGGQVNIFGLTPFLPPGSGAYVKGWYQKSAELPPLYVSKGVGTSIFPMRIGAQSEITIFNLKI